MVQNSNCGPVKKWSKIDKKSDIDSSAVGRTKKNNKIIELALEIVDSHPSLVSHKAWPNQQYCNIVDQN